MQQQSWDHEVDFLVVGSGGGGLAAGIRAHDLGASTLIVEKSDLYGGSTALSGGVVWVPANRYMARAGLADSREAGLRYLQKVTEGISSSERLQAYVEAAPRMLDYLAEHTHVLFESLADYPDYYPEEEGGARGGRSCEPLAFDARRLGSEFEHQRLHPPEYMIWGWMTVRAAEGKPLMRADWQGQKILAREALKYFLDLPERLRGRRNRRLTLGGALVARLRLSLMERGVPLWLDTPLRDLVTEGDRVAGAVVERDGRVLRVRARRGVLLAAGGFEHNAELRHRHQQEPTGSDWTVGSESNTGDTLEIGQRVGAGFDLLDDSWWCPVTRVPAEPFLRVVVFEKNLPGSIIVDQKGERFMNEAAPYNDVGKSIYRAHREGASAIPAHLVFDAEFRSRYSVGPIFPSRMQPDRRIPERLRGLLTRADTLDELAGAIGVDAAGLKRTIARFNELARSGKDLDFHRGDSRQDRFYTLYTDVPNPNLGPIEKPPFYSLRVWPGDLGTKGGLRTDANARVLRDSGDAIPGLYATGNCAASVMGRTYPGAGGTIGPSMTFGFVAAEHSLSGAS
jgi:3-oxosteroid 1-dehydrogenase